MSTTIERAALRRTSFVAGPRTTAFRLYDGFVEGDDRIVIDVFGSTLVLTDRRRDPGEEGPVRRLAEEARALVPGITAAIWKPRREPGGRPGELGHVLFGSERDLAKRIEEDGVRYAIRLRLHKDPSFFVDTRNVREFLRRESRGKRVLNTFAYTGSLGVAARAGGARQVLHTDRQKALLDVAKDSYTLNGLPIRRADFVARDFFEETSALRRAGELFDTVILDPPFFADAPTGRVDTEHSLPRLVDKVRPLVGHGGRLVLVVNALFVSGEELLSVARAMGEDGYLFIEQRIDAPTDCLPPAPTDSADGIGASPWPSNPAPFLHPTKTLVLRCERRDGRVATDTGDA